MIKNKENKVLCWNQRVHYFLNNIFLFGVLVLNCYFQAILVYKIKE